MIKIIGLRYGHSVNCRGAEKLISEVDSCRILYNKVKALLESLGYIVIDCNSNANTEGAELSEGTNKANRNKCDIYITLHMNATPCAGGVECWCHDANSKIATSIATKICKNISDLGINNRGIKFNEGYHDLSASNMEAIIVETLFCDNEKDVSVFKSNIDGFARAIASGIDSKINGTQSTSKPSYVAPPNPKPVNEKVNVTYQTYTNGKWLPNVVNLSDYAGILGQSISGLYANTNKGYLKYRVHTVGGDWLPWVIDRQDYAGILGKNIDGIQMQLLELSSYSVSYRVYVGGRWLPWVADLSDYAGIYGQSISGVQIDVVKK